VAKYVPDVNTKRWVIIAPGRSTRSNNVEQVKRVCPFCVGNEAMTPPEVYRIGSGEKDKPGWQIRVFPNLFPITDIHEVIVHSPDHEKNIEDFSSEQVENIIKTYINRFNVLKNKGKVFIFQNYSINRLPQTKAKF